MKRYLYILCSLAIAATFVSRATVLAGEQPGEDTVLIKLRDRSQVVGTIESLQDGTYRVKTQTLGVLDIPAGRITAITYDEDAVESAARQSATSQDSDAIASSGLNSSLPFESIMRSITSNPKLMKRIEKLQEDPEVQAVLNDPEVMKAIENNNFFALMKNEKIRGLLDNKAVSDLADDVMPGK